MTQDTARPRLPILVQNVDPPAACGTCLLHDLPHAFLPAAPEERVAIAAFRSGTRAVPAGQAIIEEAQRSTHLYTLYAGWAFRYKTLSDGRRQILHFLLPGDLMGLQDEFAEGYTHGVEAATDVRLCAFPRDRLWSFFQCAAQDGLCHHLAGRA